MVLRRHGDRFRIRSPGTNLRGCNVIGGFTGVSLTLDDTSFSNFNFFNLTGEGVDVRPGADDVGVQNVTMQNMTNALRGINFGRRADFGSFRNISINCTGMAGACITYPLTGPGGGRPTNNVFRNMTLRYDGIGENESLNVSACSGVTCNVTGLNSDDTAEDGATIPKNGVLNTTWTNSTFSTTDTLDFVTFVLTHSGEPGITENLDLVFQDEAEATEYCAFSLPNSEASIRRTIDLTNNCSWSQERLDDLSITLRNRDAASGDDAFISYIDLIINVTPIATQTGVNIDHNTADSNEYHQVTFLCNGNRAFNVGQADDTVVNESTFLNCSTGLEIGTTSIGGLYDGNAFKGNQVGINVTDALSVNNTFLENFFCENSIVDATDSDMNNWTDNQCNSTSGGASCNSVQFDCELNNTIFWKFFKASLRE